MAAVGVAALAACNPTFNWREVRVAPTGLVAMFPCKPDKAARNVTMGGAEVSLQALGCDAGGSTFALLFAEIGASGRTGEILGQWKAASLANMRGKVGQEQAFRPPGAIDLPQSQQVRANGQRRDGSAVQSQAAYFAHGRHVFQAAIYGNSLGPETTQPFFSGLRFE